jgi:hypothetical protein
VDVARKCISTGGVGCVARLSSVSQHVGRGKGRPRFHSVSLDRRRTGVSRATQCPVAYFDTNHFPFFVSLSFAFLILLIHVPILVSRPRKPPYST